MYYFEANPRKGDQSFGVDYSPKYIESRNRIIGETQFKREGYREILNDHLLKSRGHGLLEPSRLASLGGINFLLSGSRGGSSITVDILKQQAQSTTGTGVKILSLPGEQRPYLELAHLTPPFKSVLSDKLDKSLAGGGRSESLLSELASEIGYPISRTTDIKGFAISTYGRLLLQWPNVNFGTPDLAIRKIEDAIKQVSQVIDDKFTYVDEVYSREQLMYLLKSNFSKID